MVAATQQTSGLGYKYLSNFSQRVALYCNESSEYSTLFERCRMKLKPIPGRSIVSIDKKFYEAQTYLAFPAEREIDKVKEISAFIQEQNGKDKGMGAPGMGRTNYLCYFVQELLQNRAKEPVNISIIDDKRGRLQLFDKYVNHYSTSYTDIQKIIQETYDILQKRHQKKKSGELISLEKETLECIILNAKDVYEIIDEHEELSRQCIEILTTYSGMKVCMILSDLPNVTLQSQTSLFMKLLKNKMNMLIFQQLQDQKVTEILPAIQKQYQKPLTPGEAYFKFGTYFGKYRTPYFEGEKINL